MREWFSATELVELALPGMPNTRRGVNKVVEANDWKHATDRLHRPLARRRKGAGGGWEYHYALLSTQAQIALAAAALKVEASHDARAATEPQPKGLRDADLVRRDARIAVVKLADTHARKSGLATYAADKLFAKLFSAGAIDVEPWVSSAVETVSARSLRRWRLALKAEGPQALAGGFRRSKRSPLERAADGAVSTYIAALVVKNTHLTADHIRDLVTDRFGKTVEVNGRQVPLPGIRAFQKHIAKWKSEHAHELLKLTDPDRWKSVARVSGRNMNAHVVRINQLWEIDASPADVLCTDGRYQLYLVIDIWSRRILVLVTKTPRTMASLQLVRRAIVEWGVPEELRTDRGSDFKSSQFKRALNSLSIDHDLLPAHRPEKKGTVERHIGTVQRDFIALLPGFIGHSVADRKQIEARKTFAARLGETADNAFCVELTSDELQAKMDAWIADKYSHRRHDGLNGQTPFERAASWMGAVNRIQNVRALDLLLAPVAGSNGMRKVTKHGIKLDGTYFMAAELFAGKSVFVREDPSDMGRVFCFESEAGEFVCEAIAPERLGIDPASATEIIRKRQAKIMKDGVAEIRREMRNIKARDMVDGVLRQAAADSENLVEFPHQSNPHLTPSLEQAAIAREEEKRPQLTDEQRDAHERLVAEHDAGAESAAQVHQLPETPRQRFARALEIQLAIEEGREVSTEDALWLGRYQNDAEYGAQSKIFEDFGQGWLQAPK